MYKRLILLSLTFFIFLTGCTYGKQKTAGITNKKTALSQNETKDFNKEIELLKKQLVQDDKTIQELTDKSKEFELFKNYTWEELDYYLQFIDKATKYLSEAELLSLARDEWKYTLEIDGNPISKNALVELDKSNFKIVISEEQVPFPALSNELHKKGKLPGKRFVEQLKFINYKPLEVSDELVATTKLSTQYDFRGVPKGTTIKIEVTKELQERLGLAKNIVSIAVK